MNQDGQKKECHEPETTCGSFFWIYFYEIATGDTKIER